MPIKYTSKNIAKQYGVSQLTPIETLIKLTKKYLQQPIKVNSTIVSKYI